MTEQAGRDAADAYQARIEARLRSLAEYPARGTPRENLGVGIRSIPFERRIVIFYRVNGDEVFIERVLGGAQRLEGRVN